MKNLILRIYNPGTSEKPETTITIPISALHIAMKLLPRKAKSSLEKEGIDISQCSELIKEKHLKGTLIEIENPTERVVISVE